MTNSKKQTRILNTLFTRCKSSEESMIYDTMYDKSIDSQTLYKNILSVQSYLYTSWCKKGDRVVIFLKDQIDFITVLIAVLSLWWIAVILEPEMWKSVMREKIKQCTPKYMFLEGILYDIFRYDAVWIFEKLAWKNYPRELYDFCSEIIVWGRSFFAPEKKKLKNIYHNQERESFDSKLSESDEALIVFTWGTTWNPKWVIHTHGSLYETMKQVQSVCGSYKVFYADLFHFALLGIATGSKVILGNETYSPKKVWEIFTKFSVECSFFAPYKLQKFTESQYVFTPQFKCIITGSAPVYKSFLERFIPHISEKTKLLCLYGMTEILPIAYIDGREKVKIDVQKGDVIWYPMRSVEWGIHSDEELFVSAPHAATRYIWNSDTSTIQTWDLLEYTDDIFIMKWRKKDMILRGNYNIYPGVYEPVIQSIPWVREVAMFWVQENDTDEYIVLLVHSEQSYTQREFQKLLTKWSYSIDSYALPQYIFFWEIPKYGRQKKIQKNKLSEIYSKQILWK